MIKTRIKFAVKLTLLGLLGTLALLAIITFTLLHLEVSFLNSACSFYGVPCLKDYRCYNITSYQGQHTYPHRYCFKIEEDICHLTHETPFYGSVSTHFEIKNCSETQLAFRKHGLSDYWADINFEFSKDQVSGTWSDSKDQSGTASGRLMKGESAVNAYLENPYTQFDLAAIASRYYGVPLISGFSCFNFATVDSPNEIKQRICYKRINGRCKVYRERGQVSQAYGPLDSIKCNENNLEFSHSKLNDQFGMKITLINDQLEGTFTSSRGHRQQIRGSVNKGWWDGFLALWESTFSSRDEGEWR